MEVRITVEPCLSIEGAKEVISAIREIEKEYSCNCTLLEIKIINTFREPKS